MSAPVLSLSDQKAAISGKKKKKKTIKNVLTVPNNVKIEPRNVQIGCVKKLTKILERLLPTARLPVEKPGKSNQNSNENSTDETQLKIKAKNRRNQLSLGVNALNRSIKNELISAVLFADNIQPKFLIHHLNLLCNHKKIPFIHMPGLRDITKNTLGFPCIALGFKKDFCDFSEAVKEINSLFETSKTTPKEVKSESESDSEEITDDEIDKSDEVKSDETPFSYLIRTSNKERVFVPEKSNNEQAQKEKDTGFINFQNNDDTVTLCENESSPTELSLRFRNKKTKLKKLEDFDKSEMDDDEEDLEVPKKKLKKDWVIDKSGTKQNVRYYSANVMKFSSNPDRNKKNK